MKTWIRRSLHAGALTAGALLASGAAAHAGPTLTSTDHVGAANGTQALVPVQAPVSLCGNAAAVGGAATAACQGGATATLRPHGWPTMVSADSTGIGNGTQVVAPIQAPVDVCGNAIAVLGAARAGCEGGATATHEPDRDPGYHHGGSQGYDGGSQGYDGGSQGYDGGGTSGGSSHADGGATEVTSLTSTDHVGLLNGTQLLAPIQLPVSVCGNAIAVLGTAEAGCEGGATATQP